MKAYVGQTRSSKLIAQLEQLGIGECTVRGELAPRRTSAGWFYDNGAFGDFSAQRPFDAVQFTRDQWAITNGGRGAKRFPAPDFIVLPDRVGGGTVSLSISLEWKSDRSITWGAPLYLAVQDGMKLELVAAALDREGDGIGGIFVGGTLDWKLLTAELWVQFAHARGLRCHVGRVGTANRVKWAQGIGVDSIDSTQPLWSRGHLEAFAGALVSS